MARTPLILASALASVAAVSSWPSLSKRISPPANSQVTPLADSTWKGRDGDGKPLSCRFVSNGSFQFAESFGPSGGSGAGATIAWFDGGKWHQDGTTVTIQMNQVGTIYTGRITGSRISGSVTAPDGRDRSWWISRTR